MKAVTAPHKEADKMQQSKITLSSLSLQSHPQSTMSNTVTNVSQKNQHHFNKQQQQQQNVHVR
jgi:hypothetical protein